MLLLSVLDELSLAPLKWTRVISSAVQVGSEMDTMIRRTRAQKRKRIPGMQKVRLIVTVFVLAASLLVREDRTQYDGSALSKYQ